MTHPDTSLITYEVFIDDNGTGTCDSKKQAQDFAKSWRGPERSCRVHERWIRCDLLSIRVHVAVIRATS